MELCIDKEELKYDTRVVCPCDMWKLFREKGPRRRRGDMDTEVEVLFSIFKKRHLVEFYGVPRYFLRLFEREGRRMRLGQVVQIDFHCTKPREGYPAGVCRAWEPCAESSGDGGSQVWLKQYC